MADKIYVATKRPGQPPRHVWLTNSLPALQKAVGGYIETVTLMADLVIICDEEGRLKGAPYNCNICGVDFVGDIVIAGVRGEEFADLPCDWQALKKLFPGLWEVQNDDESERKH